MNRKNSWRKNSQSLRSLRWTVAGLSVTLLSGCISHPTQPIRRFFSQTFSTAEPSAPAPTDMGGFSATPFPLPMEQPGPVSPHSRVTMQDCLPYLGYLDFTRFPNGGVMPGVAPGGFGVRPSGGYTPADYYPPSAPYDPMDGRMMSQQGPYPMTPQQGPYPMTPQQGPYQEAPAPEPFARMAPPPPPRHPAGPYFDAPRAPPYPTAAPRMASHPPPPDYESDLGQFGLDHGLASSLGREMYDNAEPVRPHAAPPPPPAPAPPPEPEPAMAAIFPGSTSTFDMLPPGMDHFGTIGGPPPAPSVPMSGGNGSFYINLGAYLEPKNADRQMEDLIRGGFSAERETVESNGLIFQRVRTGPFPTREMAEQRLQQITHQIGTKGYVASGN